MMLKLVSVRKYDITVIFFEKVLAAILYSEECILYIREAVNVFSFKY